MPVVLLVQRGCKGFGVDNYSHNLIRPVGNKCGFEEQLFMSERKELSFVGSK